MKRNEALKIAARVCGPVVTGELLKQGMTVAEGDSEVLTMAVKNPAFGKDLAVLGQLLQPQAISNRRLYLE
ncbi:hypothetical protein DIPPA_05789 [Diplonema papillatum]|nr:hypothetical protein DIPPA_05789 [Diplonema papillatum]